MFAVVGWLCAICGTCLVLPQFLRIVKSRSTAGVSLLSWQLWACVGLVWCVHGLVEQQVTMVLPNAASAAFATCILVMIYRDRRLGLVQLLGGPIILVVLGILLRLVGGPIAFSVFMLLPQAIAVLGQFCELVRCPDLFGVSGAYLRAAVAMQTLWLLYGIVGEDIACTISSVMMVVLVSLNLGVYVLRRTGRVSAQPTFAHTIVELLQGWVPGPLRVNA